MAKSSAFCLQLLSCKEHVYCVDSEKCGEFTGNVLPIKTCHICGDQVSKESSQDIYTKRMTACFIQMTKQQEVLGEQTWLNSYDLTILETLRSEIFFTGRLRQKIAHQYKIVMSPIVTGTNQDFTLIQMTDEDIEQGMAKLNDDNVRSRLDLLCSATKQSPAAAQLEVHWRSFKRFERQLPLDLSIENFGVVSTLGCYVKFDSALVKRLQSNNGPLKPSAHLSAIQRFLKSKVTSVNICKNLLYYTTIENFYWRTSEVYTLVKQPVDLRNERSNNEEECKRRKG